MIWGLRPPLLKHLHKARLFITFVQLKQKYMTRDILQTITDTLDLQVDRSEVREIERQIQGGDYNDFYAEIDGGEYRFIHEEFIWNIYVEGIKELTQDGYLGGTDLDKHYGS